MSLIPWTKRATTPFLRDDLESFFEDFFKSGETRSHLPQALRGPVPPLNVAETEGEIIATIELPGMDEKDIDVEVFGDRLVVSGERKWEAEKKGKEFHRVESQYGSFRRSIVLPEGLVTDGDSVQATFSKGILEIKIPKAEPKPVAKVKVKAAK